VSKNYYRGGYNMSISVEPVDRWSVDIEEDMFSRQIWLIKQNDTVRGRLIIDVCNVSIGGMSIDIDGCKLQISIIDNDVVVQEHRSDDVVDRDR